MEMLIIMRWKIIFKQKLTTLNGDLQFFKNILNDCKKSDDKELNTEIPNYHQIYNAIEQLENSIKVLKDELTDNNKTKIKLCWIALGTFKKFRRWSDVV